MALKKTRLKGGWQAVVLDYLGAVCVYCSSTERLHIHHIVPMSRGGENTMANLEVVCNGCHHAVHKAWNLMPRKTVTKTLECSFCGTRVEKKLSVKNPVCDRCVFRTVRANNYAKKKQ